MVEREVARRISSLLPECGAKLNESVRLLQERCSEEEFQQYKQAVAKVMGYMLTEIMNPLYERHPDLKPKQLL